MKRKFGLELALNNVFLFLFVEIVPFSQKTKNKKRFTHLCQIKQVNGQRNPISQELSFYYSFIIIIFLSIYSLFQLSYVRLIFRRRNVVLIPNSKRWLLLCTLILFIFWLFTTIIFIRFMPGLTKHGLIFCVFLSKVAWVTFV